jgi:hypothetical protein
MKAAGHRRAASAVSAGAVRWLAVLGVAVGCSFGLSAGCRSGSDTLGLPDAYLVFAPARDKDGHAVRSAQGLPLLQPVPLDDARAVPFHKLFGDGFGAEMLRTDYLLKQFIRERQGDARFPAPARAAASEPTVFVLDNQPPLRGLGLATSGFFGGATDHAGVAWLALPEAPDSDPALAQTVSGRLGRHIAATLAAGGDPAAGVADGAGVPAALVTGYAWAMEVIAREWRVGDGPRGTLSPDAGTRAQRELFAAVRQNRFVMSDATDAGAAAGTGSPRLRSAAEILQDPGVAATVIYRMAQSKGVGHRVAPAALYAPFVAERVPNGISPAAVLGPFRNFQAKLIAVWGGAVLRGTPPLDIADLVQAYAAALPAERSEVIRLFVVTTFGATVKPGGVSSSAADSTAALAELTALAAEVAAGRRPLRPTLNAGK